MTGPYAIDAFATYHYPAQPTVYGHPQWFWGWDDGEKYSHYTLSECDRLIAQWTPLWYDNRLSPWELGFLSGVKYRRMKLRERMREAMANY